MTQRKAQRWYVILPHRSILPAAGVAAVQPRYVRPEPGNRGTIFILGDRWPKRVTRILPRRLLETTLGAPPPTPTHVFPPNHPYTHRQSRSNWRQQRRWHMAEWKRLSASCFQVLDHRQDVRNPHCRENRDAFPACSRSLSNRDLND